MTILLRLNSRSVLFFLGKSIWFHQSRFLTLFPGHFQWRDEEQIFSLEPMNQTLYWESRVVKKLFVSSTFNLLKWWYKSFSSNDFSHIYMYLNLENCFLYIFIQRSHSSWNLYCLIICAVHKTLADLITKTLLNKI